MFNIGLLDESSSSKSTSQKQTQSNFTANNKYSRAIRIVRSVIQQPNKLAVTSNSELLAISNPKGEGAIVYAPKIRYGHMVLSDY